MGKNHETDLSTVHHPPQAHAWLPGSHENPRRPRSIAYASRERARAPRRLTRAAAKFSFSRASRLGGRHAYASVLAFQCSVTGDFFQVYARPNSRTDSRLGITVIKRIVPRATARNYCKRLAREVFRKHRIEFSGVDFVVRSRSVVLPASSALARAEIIGLMRRACVAIALTHYHSANTVK